MKFTIAIPAYKDVFFREAIESVINQTCKDWELIILNDFSPEDIEKIALEYITESRIRYYKNEKNVGAYNLVDNWNRCLELAQGEFLICMGDDDVLREDCLEVYQKYISQYPEYDIYHAATELIDEKSEFFRYQEARPLTESVYSMVWHRLTRKRDQYVGDFLYKVSHLRSKGGFYKLPLAWGSDDITAYRCSMRHGRLNIPEYIFKYRVSRYTISRSGNTREKLEAIALKYEWICDNIITSKPESDVDNHYREMIDACLPSAKQKEVMSLIGYSNDRLTFRFLRNVSKFCRSNHVNFSIFCAGMLYRILLRNRG